MNICFATSECVPYAKTGGLADVAGSLPKALAQEGCTVKVFMPLYESINTLDHNLTFCEDLGEMSIPISEDTRYFYTWYGKLPDSEVEVYFIDCPHYYHRPHLYTSDWDEDERFIFLQHAIFKVMQRYHWSPDIIHCNDWHTGLMPALLKQAYNWDELFARTACFFSIHNIGYQGLFSGSAIGAAGLSYDYFYPGGPFEKDGAFSFMKTGILFSEIVSTVSRTYAHEIQTSEFGAGLENTLRRRHEDLFGVINGIDTTDWNPAIDPHIPYTYTANDLRGKAQNKQALLEELHLPYHPDTPVIGLISRFTPQKGFELLFPIMGEVLQSNVQFVILGSGEGRYESFFENVARAYPHKVSTYIGYNNPLAHRITAGADLFLMPSQYEPCGMNQMFSLNYGTLPIVRKTGGLADTVRDYHEFPGQGNGFSFADFSPQALYFTLQRALDRYADQDEWTLLMQRGMEEDFTWTVSAKRYINLYHKAMEKRRYN